MIPTLTDEVKKAIAAQLGTACPPQVAGLMGHIVAGAFRCTPKEAITVPSSSEEAAQVLREHVGKRVTLTIEDPSGNHFRGGVISHYDDVQQALVVMSCGDATYVAYNAASPTRLGLTSDSSLADGSTVKMYVHQKR